MSKNYEDYKPIYEGPPRKRSNSMLLIVQYAIVFLLVAALIVSAVYFVYLHKNSENAGDEPIDTSFVNTLTPETQPSNPSEDETEPQETVGETEGPDSPEVPVIDNSSYTELEFSKNKINKGSLIYVSSNYKVVYPDNDELIAFYGNKAASYQLSSGTMKIHKDILGNINNMMNDFVKASGKSDVIIWTSYRDEARQTQVYNDYVATHGEEAAKSVVAKPGESDHHTALGIALRVYGADGMTYKISEIEGYSWVEENCYKYGFVERYPDDKKDITGFEYTSSLYLRYVGVPHAELMKKNNLCLEEYMIMIKDYAFGTAHYEFTDETGNSYEIYYVRSEGEGETVNVPVPVDKEYTVSGNNMDGFIVTVKK